MRRAIAILTVLALALTAGPALSADPPRSPFTDVATSNRFLADIVWLAGSGVTTGFPDGSFHPSEPISREAFAAFLYRYTHPGTQPPSCTGEEFDDVPVSHPFCGHITWLADTGITTGYPDGGFHPGSRISREAVAAMLQRYRSLAVNTESTCNPTRFRDLAGSTFCREISWLAGTGITTGYPDGTFRPSAPVTREAVAAYLHRYEQTFGPLDLPGCGDFSTQPQAQEWFDLYHEQYGDIAVLDPDGDLLACESLPNPENASPVAVFVASASGLTVDVDGSGSTDPDGTVQRYAWSFGDGGTATGAQASHSYAEAGTYTVTLTLTDDDGATAVATRGVTVTAPPPTSVECGQTVIADVTLLEDLECSGTGLVLTSGVTLDLGGHTVRYVGPADPAPGTAGVMGWGEGEEAPISDVVVRNGTIAGYALAVEFGVPDGLLLEDLDVDGRVDALFGDDITVRRSRVRGDVSAVEAWAVTLVDNVIEGSVWLQAGDSSVIGNHVDAGGGVGVSLVEASSPAGAVVADNTVRSASIGIELAWHTSNTVVRDNEITDSGVGIELGGYLLEGNVLRGNVITDVAGHGILGDELGVEEPLVVEENVVRNAGGDGIRFVLDEDGTLPLVGLVVSRNQVTDVLGHAIYAPWATGEGNVTASIGTTPACVGPVCVSVEGGDPDGPGGGRARATQPRHQRSVRSLKAWATGSTATPNARHTPYASS